MKVVKCIEKFRDKHGKIQGYRLLDSDNNSQDVEASALKDAILNNQLNVVNLTLTKDGRLIEKKLENKNEVYNKPNNCNKEKRPYDAESYTEFIKLLASLVEKTFKFNTYKEKLKFGSFNLDPSTKEILWLSGVMGDFIYKGNKCYIELDYTYDVDTKDGVILFDVMIQEGDGSPQYTFKYEFDSSNMKAHFSHILKGTQQFIYHVMNNWDR